MKSTTIVIDGREFTYQDEIEEMTHESSSPISEEEARMLLDTAKEFFNSIGLSYCLSFGTLLGAVRDKTLIKGDEDVDVYIENESVLRSNLQYLSDNGFQVCRIMEGILYSFRVNGSKAYIDAYVKKELPLSLWSIWCCSICNFAIPRWLVREKDTIQFLGSAHPIPKHPERLLKYWYGKTWATPVRGHKFKYDSPSRYWWRLTAKPAIFKVLRKVKHLLIYKK